MKAHARIGAAFCFVATVLAEASQPCTLDCLTTRLVATAQELREAGGNDIYDPMSVAAGTLVDIATVQAKDERFQQAAGTVAALADLPLAESVRHRYYAGAYAALAEAHAAAGRVDDADALFAQAIEAAHASGDPPDWLHADIAKALFSTHRTEAAQEVLSRVSRAIYRAPVIADMATALAQSGDVDAARQMLASAFDAVADDSRAGYSRVGAFADITGALVALGEVPAALALASTIESESEIETDLLRVGTMAAIAVAQAKTGAPEAAQETLWGAVEIANSITDSHVRADAVRVILQGGDLWYHGVFHSENLGVAGVAVALRLKTMAAAIPEASNGRYALLAVVSALANAGENAAAFAAAEEIHSLHYRMEAFANIAREQAADGQIEDARTTVRRIEEEVLQPGTSGCGYYCDEALGAIAKAEARAGQFDAALATLAQIMDGHDRLDALSDIARTMASHSAQP